ncbi:MAG: DUF4252 domain-containing protein [Acidobacteriota bacterium]
MTIRAPLSRARFGVASLVTALVFALSAVALATPAAAQDIELLPGFVDFESFGDFDLDDLTVEINLGNGLLKMLSGAVAEEDGEFGELLQGLRLIKVNIFEADGAKDASDSLRGALRELRRDGWETVVSIRDEENLHILLRTQGESILGVLAAFSDDESFGLVNIVGNFDPEQIGRLARQLDIEPLEDLDLSGMNKRSRDDG